MSLQLRPFQQDDRQLAESLKDPAKACLRILDKRGFVDELFVIEPTYGTKVWADRLLQVSDPKIQFEQPIGIVLRGTLEVTEGFVCGHALRRRTTAILRAGDFFGLFEAFGNLRGFWDITAGVQRFLITSPLGNATALGRKGWKDVRKPQLRTLQHRVEADYDYSDFIDFAKTGPAGQTNEASPWTCRILLFDLKKIRDSEAERLLLSVAVHQLASLARQNPPDAMFPESRRRDTAEHLRVGATLDAILADHIPVFSAYSADHEAYGPFNRLLETLCSLAGPGSNEPSEGARLGRPIYLWVPDYWSRVKSPVALYVDVLARKFEMKGADELLKVGPRGLELRSGTQIVPVPHAGDAKYSVQVTTAEGKRAIILRLAVQRKAKRIPMALHNVLFPPDTPKGLTYGWPLHLGSGLILLPPS